MGLVNAHDHVNKLGWVKGCRTECGGRVERNRDVRQLKQSKRGRRSHRGTARSDESATRELKGGKSPMRRLRNWLSLGPGVRETRAGLSPSHHKSGRAKSPTA